MESALNEIQQKQSQPSAKDLIELKEAAELVNAEVKKQARNNGEISSQQRSYRIYAKVAPVLAQPSAIRPSTAYNRGASHKPPGVSALRNVVAAPSSLSSDPSQLLVCDVEND